MRQHIAELIKDTKALLEQPLLTGAQLLEIERQQDIKRAEEKEKESLRIAKCEMKAKLFAKEEKMKIEELKKQWLKQNKKSR